VGGPAPVAMVARARYMEARAKARYYQDILDGTGADYQPYAAHRAETSWIQRSQGGAATAGGSVTGRRWEPGPGPTGRGAE
ncbi:hypothetical protein KI387_011724, partial [Taxus chinensis]